MGVCFTGWVWDRKGGWVLQCGYVIGWLCSCFTGWVGDRMGVWVFYRVGM